MGIDRILYRFKRKNFVSSRWMTKEDLWIFYAIKDFSEESILMDSIYGQHLKINKNNRFVDVYMVNITSCYNHKKIIIQLSV